MSPQRAQYRGVAARSGVLVPCGAAHSADPDVVGTSGHDHRKLFTDDIISRGHRTFIYLTMTGLTASKIIKLEALPNWEFGPHKNFSSRLLVLLVSPFDTVSAPKARVPGRVPGRGYSPALATQYHIALREPW